MKEGIDLGIINAIDNSIISIIENSMHSYMLDNIMPVITHLGGILIWIVIAVIFILTKKYRKYGVVLLVTLGACIVLGDLCIKPIVKRIRPCNVYDALNLIISAPTGYSFPSGHSMRSFAAAVILLKANKKIGIPAFILAFLTAISRVYLYAHYFTDVFVGALLGILCALCIYKLLIENDKVNKFLENKSPLLWG